MNMRAISMLLCLAGVVAPLAARAFDHYDPAALTAEARRAMREGDLRAACVLLWRADQLAPHDKRMNLAWRELEALQKGQPVGDDPAPKAEPAASTARTPAATPAPTKPVAPEPPAPWPAK